MGEWGGNEDGGGDANPHPFPLSSTRTKLRHVRGTRQGGILLKSYRVDRMPIRTFNTTKQLKTFLFHKPKR